MIDTHGRRIHKLRLSVTDHCQFRCLYCLPEQVQFTPSQQFLHFDEIIQLVRVFQSCGIDTIRLTGGEPLLRPQLPTLIGQLKNLGLKVTLSTNGQWLLKSLSQLKISGLDGINLSLDTLRSNQLEKISRRDCLAEILTALKQTVAIGIPVKTNTVVMRGVNDDQIIPIMNLSRVLGFEPRFLELMKIGPLRDEHQKYFVPASEMQQKIEAAFGKSIRVLAPVDSTAMLFQNNLIPQFGIIASESFPFCSNCSRLRLTATGKLFGCMMDTRGIDLRAYLRWMPEQIPAAITEAITFKPMERIPFSAQKMYVLGG